jgi:hypothetical protein
MVIYDMGKARKRLGTRTHEAYTMSALDRMDARNARAKAIQDKARLAESQAKARQARR